MPLSVEQEALCQRLEKEHGATAAAAAALIRQLAGDIDSMWDRLSRVYALARQETPEDPIQNEIAQLRAELEQRQDRPPLETPGQS
jgi:hypothetical protein